MQQWGRIFSRFSKWFGMIKRLRNKQICIIFPSCSLSGGKQLKSRRRKMIILPWNNTVEVWNEHFSIKSWRESTICGVRDKIKRQLKTFIGIVCYVSISKDGLIPQTENPNTSALQWHPKTHSKRQRTTNGLRQDP